MSRTSLLLAALLVVPACDSGAKADDANKTAKADATNKADKADAANKGDAPNKEEAPKVDPWQKKLAARVLADSGLAKDGKITAFDVVNSETGKEYCQVCSFGISPKLMLVGTADDEAFHEDLKNLDAIAQKYGEDIKAFAVITEIEDGKGITPTDVEASKKAANELREKLAIKMPVVVPAPDKDGKNVEWDEYYNITKSRTVMFTNGGNVVQYSAVGPADWSELNDAIKTVTES